MKILNLLPVIDTGFWTDEMTKYISKFLLPSTQVDTWYLDRGPASIEGEYDECLAAAAVVLKCIEAEKAGYDAIFVDCFGDPGVRAAREAVNIPVFGGFEPVVQYALGTSDKVSIVTVLPEVLPMIGGLVAKAGIEKRFAKIRCINIPVLHLGDIRGLIDALADESIKAIEEDRAGTIVLGCTAMTGVKEEVEKALMAAGYDIPVLEAAQSALVMLETFVRMGIHHSRKHYMPPRDKPRTWWEDNRSVKL